MGKKSINRGKVITSKSNTGFFRNLAIIVFIIKIFVAFSITPLVNWKYQGHMWLGADGENYLIGVNALSRDGLFSNQEILNYWPAGYPIFIYLFGIFGSSNALTFLGLIQSAIFSFAVYLFTLELFKSRFRRISKILCIFLLINPTISLSSLSVGYESLCVSCFLLVVAISVQRFRVEKVTSNRIQFLVIGLLLSFIAALQPRLIISGILIAIILIFKRNNFMNSLLKVGAFSVIVVLLPSALIVRNHFASGLNVLSLNLGTTMNIGAGEGATGGYMGNYKGVPCRQVSESDFPATSELPSNYDKARSKNDSVRIACVLSWYLDNPAKIPQLFWNKTIYFWSPWIGPLSVGTMARNPWFQNNPLKEMSKTQDGLNLVYGSLGKLVSWIWVIASFSLMMIGLIRLLKFPGLTRQLSLILSSIIFPSWLVTLLTLGDNRFRLPIMGAIITLQVVGLNYFLGKLNRKTASIDIV